MRLLVGDLVAALEALDSAGGINYPPLAGEERVTFAAKLNPEELLGRSGGEGIAAGADHLGIFVVCRMNLFFHGINWA